MRKPTIKESPGVTRLRTIDAGPRPKLAHTAIASIVSIPKPKRRRRRKPVEKQAALFDNADVV